MDTAPRVRAGQYLRMSTDQQQYSLANQAAAIADYASTHGFDIVRTYEDAGRSGVVLRNRHGLQGLLDDVLGGKTNFEAVLVYDVSRWGRFQDCDEAAHYEFLCRQAGIQILYCAEPFANDGTMPSSITKALKRAMAAEYSRELGVKCFAGQKRLALMGFRVGGQAGYGMQRMMVSADGKRKQKLKDGEYKNLTTDRVILVPGSRKEVRVVRLIFTLALKMRVSDVVLELNRRGLLDERGKQWEYTHVWDIINNPKYAGCNAWARTAAKLRGRPTQTDRDKWVLCPGAFRPIVSQHLFDAVQAAHRKRNTPMSDEELLNRLRRLLRKRGKLSQDLMLNSVGVPSKSTYVRRFGGIYATYKLVGYRPSRRSRMASENYCRIQRQQEAMVARVAQLFPGKVEGCVLHGGRAALKLDTGATVSVLICQHYLTPSVSWRRWEFLPRREERGHITLLALMDSDNIGCQRFFVMPWIDKATEYQIKDESDPWLNQGVRLDALRDFYLVANGMVADALQAS